MKVTFQLLFFVAVSIFAVNEAISKDPVYLGDRHVSEFGMKCGDCHNEEPPAKLVETAKCVSCHGTLKEIGENTELKDLPNPHINHNEELYCEDCHKGHKPPEIFCSQCHEFKFQVP